MLAELKTILDIQEVDMKMIRLLRLRKERMKEIEQIDVLRSELGLQLEEKNKEVEALSLEIQVLEEKIQEINARVKKLEAQQGSVKKVDEFNTLTQEPSIRASASAPDIPAKHDQMTRGTSRPRPPWNGQHLHRCDEIGAHRVDGR
jgi:predicted  nucleic acid-binding Zn-ribbon protein